MLYEQLVKTCYKRILPSLFTMIIISFFCSCTHVRTNPYQDSSPQDQLKFKKLPIPLPKGTPFTVTQGAFGKYTHSEPGNEYHWDLAVPYDTEVIAVEGGKVLGTFEPNKGGGCNPKFSNLAHVIQIEHQDKSVAQYVHIKSLVKKGMKIKKGDVIAHTANNGFTCLPHLHFGVFKSKEQLYDSPTRETLPIYFLGIGGGILIDGKSYIFEEK